MEDLKNSKFIVSVIVRSEHSPPLPFDAQRWQEVVVVVMAIDGEEAKEKGEKFAQEYEAEYVSATGDLVKWKIEGVSGVWPLMDDAISGGELFSRFLRASEGRSLLTPFED